MRKPIETVRLKPDRKPEPISRADAEAIAIQALRFLGTDAERLQRFLALSGLDAGRLRQAATAPHFLLGVLDHLMAEETLLVAFAAELACDPAKLATAHAVLRRGPDPAAG